MSESTEKLRSKLSPREWRFMMNRIREGMNQQDAYIAILPEHKKGITKNAAHVMGYRFMKRIREKLSFEELLDLQGLDDTRLLKEVNLRLDAKTKKFFPDEGTETIADNSTRLGATKLLAELRGRTSNAIVNVQQNVAIEIDLSEEEEAQFENNIENMFGDDD